MTTTTAVRQVVHLALHPPPPLRRVVQVTDLLRRAALSRVTAPTWPSMLSGHQAPGEPITGRRHPHAHWLPVGDGRIIAGVCLWVPGGLTPEELTAVREVRHIGSSALHGPLRAMTVTPVPGHHPAPSWLTGPATVWRTLTPMSLPRRMDRPSRRTPQFAAAEVARELADRGLPAPRQVVIGERARGWTTARPSRPEWIPPPHHFRIVFDRPVTGPIALGRLSHFGLGLFAAHPEEEAAC